MAKPSYNGPKTIRREEFLPDGRRRCQRMTSADSVSRSNYAPRRQCKNAAVSQFGVNLVWVCRVHGAHADQATANWISETAAREAAKAALRAEPHHFKPLALLSGLDDTCACGLAAAAPIHTP